MNKVQPMTGNEALIKELRQAATMQSEGDLDTTPSPDSRRDPHPDSQLADDVAGLVTLRCPVGLDDAREICSAGTCVRCFAAHAADALYVAEADNKVLREKIELQEIALNDMCVSLNEERGLREALTEARKMIQTRETLDELGWGKGTSPATRLLAQIDAALASSQK